MNERASALTESVRRWAEQEPAIRAALTTGSLARSDPVDDSLDADYIMVVDDPARFQPPRWAAQLGQPLIAFSERTPTADVRASVLFAGGIAAEFSFFASEGAADNVVRWLTPRDGGIPADARSIYDELKVGDSLARARTDPAWCASRVSEDRYQFVVKRFWFNTFAATLRAEKGQSWRPHILWSRVLLEMVTRMFAWIHWDRASAADPFRQGRRFETWAEPPEIEKMLRLISPSDHGILGTIHRTALAFDELSRVCAETYGFRYPDCAQEVVLKRITDAYQRYVTGDW